MNFALVNLRSPRWRWLPVLVLLVVGFHVSPLRTEFDRAFFDASTRRPLREAPIPERSAVVLIDETTLSRLGGEPYNMRWPLPRAAFSALIVALERAGAERIVMDFTFVERSDAAEQDLLLAGTAAGVRQVVLARTADRGVVFWDEEFVRANGEFFAAPRTGDVTLRSDSDGTTRRYVVPGSLAAAAFSPPRTERGGLLRWHGGIDQLQQRGVPVLSAAPFIEAGLPIAFRLEEAAPDYSPRALAAALAHKPALDGATLAQVRGRTVFVGANAAGTYDLKSFPLSTIEPGVLVHWTAWANLAGSGFIAELPRWLTLALAAAAALAGLLAAERWPGVRAPVFGAAAAGALLLLGSYAALSAGWFVPPATPSAAVLFTLVGVVIEGFWSERKRKREIQAMFGAYVDPGVVAQLVRDPESIRLGGERREATVFFSDLAGFTDLSEKLRDEPERMVEVVNAYLEETSECLLNHGAYVDKYIGDAVMAVFGAPQQVPDHALAACRAALEAQRVLEQINARYAGPVGVTLAVRIGLNTGEMIVGNLGSRRKKNYTVMGDAVNLASRLEGANKYFGTGILLGEETARRVQGQLLTRPLARLRVKGKLQAIEVHTLHGAPADLSAEEREFVASCRAGYEAHGRRDFAAAVTALENAEARRPGDLTTRRLLEESRRFLVQPPPDSWETVLALDSK